MIAEQKTDQERICISGREASAMLSISPRTLWSLTHSGQIPVVRMGRLVRYSIADLKMFVERSKSDSDRSGKCPQ
jgi:excisionase family DNA binding protein